MAPMGVPAYGAKHSPPTSPLGRPTGKIGVSTQIGNFSTVSSPSSSRKLSLTVSFVIIFLHVCILLGAASRVQPVGCHLQACNTWRMLSGSKRQIYIKPLRFKSSQLKQRPAHYGLIRRVLCTPLCGYSDAECCTFGAKHSSPTSPLGRPTGKIWSQRKSVVLAVFRAQAS